MILKKPGHYYRKEYIKLRKLIILRMVFVNLVTCSEHPTINISRWEG